MYRLQVERVVSAAHAIVINGAREPVHGHDWRVRVQVEGPRLDDEGLLCDFHALEQRLDAVLSPFNNRSLNDVQPFDAVNPTAERFAQHVAEAMWPAVGAVVHRIEAAVTEAPGCEAFFSCSRADAS